MLSPTKDIVCAFTECYYVLSVALDMVPSEAFDLKMVDLYMSRPLSKGIP